MLNFILFIVIGAAAGWLAGKIMKGKGFGFIVNLIVGVAGGFLGGRVFGKSGIVAPGAAGSFIAAVAGAVILLFIISLFKRK